jgi:hypothetical protein
MELRLQRQYHSSGTNGVITHNGELVCYTIELPWKNNAPGISCIPEGTYTLLKRFSRKFAWHLHLTGVQGRDLILVHPANDALRELKGCIAPVTVVTGYGKGLLSRQACRKLFDLTELAFQNNETILLTISAFGGD